MNATAAEKEILHLFLSSLLKLQNVDRGSIWIKKDEGYLCIEALGAQSEQVKGLHISADQPSIVGWVIEKGTMTIARAGDDERHFHALENGFDIKSTLILCYPLIVRDGTVYGAIQLIDTSAGGRQINLRQEHLALIENLVTIGSLALSNFIDYHSQLAENRKLQDAIDKLRTEQTVIGQSPAFLRALQKARSYARVDFPVLITGESGTGKEVLAREIYRMSSRGSKPFLAQNCSAIPETLLESELFGHTKGAFTGADKDKLGLFEAAHGGVVFLDEIGDMPVNLQARILRVLQNGEIKPLGGTRTKQVDVRIISATNADLPGAIAEKRFRKDLFYRLNVLPLSVPPLRERKEDIPLLLDFFLSRECRRLGLRIKKISTQSLFFLKQYPWQGNIRELENFVKLMIAAVEKDNIDLEDLPEHFLGAQDAPAKAPVPTAHAGRKQERSLERYTWQELEKSYLLSLLEHSRWNITRAAAQAGVNRSTFNSRMRKMGIRKSE